MMPVMDGRAFREEQLQTPELAAIPVVLFSAYRDVAKTAGELNAAGHLAKPLNLTTLLQTVRRYCSNGAPTPPPCGLATRFGTMMPRSWPRSRPASSSFSALKA